MKGVIFFALFGFIIVSTLCGVFILSRSYLLKFESTTLHSISKFNKITHESTSEAVKISYPLSEREFITFRSYDGNEFSFISRITDNQFQCYGTCSCNSERRNVNIMSKTLCVLFTVLSLTLAINIARDFFKEECLLNFPNCPSDSIETNFEYCEAVGNSKEFEEDLEEEFGNSEESEETRAEPVTREYIEFKCMGHCIPNWDLKDKQSLTASKKFKCKNYVFEKMTKVLIGEKLRVNRKDVIKPENYNKFKGKAIKRFMNTYLKEYCNNVSYRKYLFKGVDSSGKNLREYRSAYLCISKPKEMKKWGDNLGCIISEEYETFKWDE